MADNSTTQSGTLATLPAGLGIALRDVTYSGDANQKIAPSGIVLFEGADDAKTATDVSDTRPLPVKQVGGTSTLTNVAASASSTTVLAANAARLRAWLYNDSTIPVNIKFGATASATSFTKRMAQDEFFVVEGYTGRIDGIWDSASGNMRVTELTA